MIAEKAQRKVYEVDFMVHTLQEIADFQERETEQVAGIIDLRPEHVTTLLRHFRWDKETLIEKYTDAPETVLLNSKVWGGEGIIVRRKDFVCEVCCCDAMEVFGLSCNHIYCLECYKHYLEQKIMEMGESHRITCMGQCDLIMDSNSIKLLVSPLVFERYKILNLRNYVDDSKYLRWCPAPNCEYSIKCSVSTGMLDRIVPSVSCLCGTNFCFGCGKEPHAPCVCALVNKWLKKCQDDSETANWISANTKDCVKCRATIEKSGGCNHMTCKKCGSEWCWICLGPWSEHGTSWYNCNRYQEEAGVDAREKEAVSRALLKRYLHFYNRYANHAQSAKLSQEMYCKTERMMEEMQKRSTFTWIEVQYLKKALDVVVECRQTLKWSYAFAFYLDKCNHTELFEQNQSDLEMAVENLTELIETPINMQEIKNHKQLVLNKHVYVQQRREIMLKDTAEGLKEQRWTWSDVAPMFRSIK